LPSFQDEKSPLARIEACDTCKRYLKSIDLSLDARPIPEVDDLVSLALDLWAADQGYQRIEPGLAGI
jgi:FdhE protein